MLLMYTTCARACASVPVARGAVVSSTEHRGLVQHIGQRSAMLLMYTTCARACASVPIFNDTCHTCGSQILSERVARGALVSSTEHRGLVQHRAQRFSSHYRATCGSQGSQILSESNTLLDRHTPIVLFEPSLSGDTPAVARGH
jgi:hypothetical protein